MQKRNSQWMERDCLKLMMQLERHNKKLYDKPAQALTDVIKMLGYIPLASSRVPHDVYAYTDFDRREVIVAKDLKQRLSHPSAFQGVLHACLAHELGHIRMHATQLRNGKRHLCWEKEAHAYGGYFLIPHKEVINEPEVRVLWGGLLQDQETMWKQVLQMAERFRVTGAFMACALSRYGIVRFCPRTRLLRPANILVRRATRVA